VPSTRPLSILTRGSEVRSGVRSEAEHRLKSRKKLTISWLVRRLIVTPNRTSGEIESRREQTEIPGEQPTFPVELLPAGTGSSLGKIHVFQDFDRVWITPRFVPLRVNPEKDHPRVPLLVAFSNHRKQNSRFGLEHGAVVCPSALLATL